MADVARTLERTPPGANRRALEAYRDQLDASVPRAK